jgi:RimJ/RimL family protein N-acetyltransferase
MSSQAKDFTLQNRLAKALPDSPRYVETRAMLLADHCEIFGLDEAEDLTFVVSHHEMGLISVIGKPSGEAILRAVESGDGESDLLVCEDNLSHVETILPDWQSERAVLHRLGDSPSLPVVADGMVRFLREDEVSSLTGLADEVAEELAVAAKLTQIAATIVDNKPVSFCYAGAITETLWDISIDTREEYRNRGFAGLCVAFLIDHFNRQGKRPVWGSLESNSASMKLAAKLGFVAVDELFVFER